MSRNSRAMWRRLITCARLAIAVRLGGFLTCYGLLALVVVSLSSSGFVEAQTYSYISGAIVDASGASAPGAAVTVVNEDTGFRRMTLAETDGRYVVSSLQPGV